MSIRSGTLTRLALAVGIATPAIYFGTQLVASLFYPGYSFLSQVASELGSDRAPMPTIFNVGAFLTGLAAIVAAFGFFRALKELDVHPVWLGFVAVALISCAAGSINASLFHLPNPRHNPGLLGAGMFALPLLLPFATWKLGGWLRGFLIGNVIFIAVLAPVMGGAFGLDTHDYQGLLQRLFALTLFVPIGLVSWFLLRATSDSVSTANAIPAAHP